MFSAKRIVYMDEAVPMTVRAVKAMANVPFIGDVSHSSVMIVSRETWHVIRPGRRVHGERTFAETPTLDCPVIDVSNVPAENDTKMASVIRACTAEHAGVINMSGLVTGLVALGGKVVTPARKDETEGDEDDSRTVK